MSKPLYIFDLDGTLANVEHRVHFIRGEEKDWRAYFAACNDDEPIFPVVKVFNALRKQGECWIWTGRSEEVREQTVRWLNTHEIMDGWSPFRAPEHLMMRKTGDFRPDHELKAEWLSMLDYPEATRLTAAFDDRDAVVKMWRDAGIQCFQVAPGDF